MSKSIGSIIRKIVDPVMEKNGFSNTFRAKDGWSYEKATKDGERKQVVYISTSDYLDKFVKLEARIVPSQPYMDIPMDKIIVGDEGFKKGILDGWSYGTVDDVEKILIMIMNAMEKKGFSYLDTAESDPEDVFSKKAEERLVMENYKNYAMEFMEEHHLTGWDMSTVIDVIMQEVEKIPYVPDEKDRQKIMRMAAAYGEMLVSKGASWEWNAEAKAARVVIPYNPKIEISAPDIYPLRHMYFYILRDNRAFTKDHLLEKTLSLLKNIDKV